MELHSLGVTPMNNSLALTVKKADLLHNTSLERLNGLDEETKERLVNKYSDAFIYLNEE